MKYSIENKRNNQDGINFIDVENAKKETPSFLDYSEVLKHSLEAGFITNADEIKSLCDGGDRLEAYFSSNTAAEECESYLDSSPVRTIDDEGNIDEHYVEFDPEIHNYELF